MTDSSTPPVECTLPGSIPPIEAAPGWKVICAVKYSTLNNALLADAEPAPHWRRGGATDLQGSSNAGRLAQGVIDGVQLAPGCGGVLKWRIEVDAAHYHNTSPRLRIDGRFRFSVLIRTQLGFVADPGQPELARLQVDPHASLPTHVPWVTGVTLDPEFLAGTRLNIFDVANIEADLKTIVASTLPAHLQALFGAMPLPGALSSDALQGQDPSRLHPLAYSYATEEPSIGTQHEEMLVVLVPFADSLAGGPYMSRRVGPVVRHTPTTNRTGLDESRASALQDNGELALDSAGVPHSLWLSGSSLEVKTVRS